MLYIKVLSDWITSSNTNVQIFPFLLESLYAVASRISFLPQLSITYLIVPSCSILIPLSSLCMFIHSYMKLAFKSQVGTGNGGRTSLCKLYDCLITMLYTWNQYKIILNLNCNWKIKLKKNLYSNLYVLLLPFSLNLEWYIFKFLHSVSYYHRAIVYL